MGARFSGFVCRKRRAVQALGGLARAVVVWSVGRGGGLVPVGRMAGREGAREEGPWCDAE